MQFVSTYGTPEMVQRWNTPIDPATAPPLPTYMVLDGSVYQIRDLFLNVAISLKQYGAQKIGMLYGNEGGAILALLIALRQTPEEILDNWRDDRFNVDKLLFGNNWMAPWMRNFHIRKDGAIHKGNRLSKAIDRMLREKYGLPKNHRMTMGELHAKTHCCLTFNAFNQTRVEGVLINHETYSEMPVSKAVMCSMAAYPVIRPRYYNKEMFVAHMENPVTGNKQFYTNHISKASGVIYDKGVRIWTVAFAPPTLKDRAFNLTFRRHTLRRNEDGSDLARNSRIIPAGFIHPDY